jgi:hypothetical protein
MAPKAKRTLKPVEDAARAPGTVQEQIAKLLADDGWKLMVAEGEIHLIGNGDNGTVEVMISCEDDPQRYFVYAYCPVTVPESHRVEVSRYVVAVNPPLAFAKLMLAPSGRIYTEAGAPLGSDGLVDGKVFQILFRLALCIIDDHVPGILQIIYGGATAAEVLARREEAKAPKD